MANAKIPHRKVPESQLTYSEKCSIVFVNNRPFIQRLRRSYKWEVELECGHKRTMTLAATHNSTPTEARCRQCHDEAATGSGAPK
ncbi:MAG: hypothetical protein JRD89_09135 [Deltaproteobacteria bacterium]|nr:hypothetical protein [Deltaproteobacteria bacterium]